MNEKMNKPASMLYDEFRTGMASLITHCGLPAYLIETVIQNYLYEVRAIALDEYSTDRKQFEGQFTKEGVANE